MRSIRHRKVYLRWWHNVRSLAGAFPRIRFLPSKSMTEFKLPARSILPARPDGLLGALRLAPSGPPPRTAASNFASGEVVEPGLLSVGSSIGYVERSKPRRVFRPV